MRASAFDRRGRGVPALRACATALPLVALLGALLPRGGAHATAGPLSGTITVEMHKTYAAPGVSSSTTCSATLTLSGDGTTSEQASFTHDEQRTSLQGDNVSTTITVHEEPDEGTRFSNVFLPSVSIDSAQGISTVNYQLDPVPLKRTTTTVMTGQPTRTDVNTNFSGSCPSAASGVINGAYPTTQVAGKLTGGAQLRVTVQAHGDFDDSRGNGTVTVTWALNDPSLASATPTPQKPKSSSPTGKIKVPNNGVDATLDWNGWEIGYSGDWKATQQKPSAPPKVTSPDRKVTITLQVQSAAAQPSPAATRSTISRTARAVGHVSSIAYKPVAIGSLSGQIATVTFANSPDTLLVAVVSDGQHEAIVQTLVRPNTPVADLLEAGIAIGSLHQVGSSASGR